jgi:protein-arginine kinase activator protein McsA
MSIHRKFTLEEIHSWPEITVKEELSVLSRILKDLEREENYEFAAIVYNRMETLKANDNSQSAYQ